MRIIEWSPEVPALGAACVAIGVFDGVHLGHQSLLQATVRAARTHNVVPVAITFDRDPDQVVTPESASPQLLSLTDKLHFIGVEGIEVVIVVPFTETIAAVEAEKFLDDVVGGCCDVREIHVGHDFRFGARAEGDIDTLYAWGVEHNAEVKAHKLLEIDGAPVTSTRIRALVESGDIDSATRLLGRPHAIRGSVHSGRGDGARLGFPTANLTPLEHAALPADGVYAGLALLEDGTSWPAAISVGVPPTFPEARDYLEVHVIGFSGDLVGSSMRVEFLERLREHRAYAGLAELTSAIGTDVSRAKFIAMRHTDESVFDESEMPVVDDPVAPEAAERAVARMTEPGGQCCGPSPAGSAGPHRGEWIAVYGPARISALFNDGGVAGAMITGPLESAGIPYKWDPLSPRDVQTARPDFNWQRTFTLYVPREHEAIARELLGR